MFRGLFWEELIRFNGLSKPSFLLYNTVVLQYTLLGLEVALPPASTIWAGGAAIYVPSLTHSHAGVCMNIIKKDQGGGEEERAYVQVGLGRPKPPPPVCLCLM